MFPVEIMARLLEVLGAWAVEMLQSHSDRSRTVVVISSPSRPPQIRTLLIHSRSSANYS